VVNSIRIRAAMDLSYGLSTFERLKQLVRRRHYSPAADAARAASLTPITTAAVAQPSEAAA
jgi:hypothetical protein